MKKYTDAELESLLDEVESDRIERKESWKGDAPEKSRQAVCAFSNDLPDHRLPGVLIVGAKDDGKPSGAAIDDRLLLTLSDLKTDGQILPPPTIVIEKRLLKGAAMAVVHVQPSHAPPVRYSGRVWIRLGPRRGVATVQDERILNEKRRFGDLPFDIQPIPSATLSELSKLIFENEYLPNAFARDVLEANERSYEQRLSACRMVASSEEPIPTVLGLLAIGKSPRDWLPGAYIQFVRFEGTELDAPIIDESLISGSLGDILRRIDDKIESHNRSAVDLKSASTELRQSPYPKAALQQLIRNAVLHRTYESTNAPVRVYWFNDRIEIHNPGGPFGTVTVENFGTPGITDYRNPHIADAMKVLGFVQRFGVGIATAKAELAKNGNPPPEFTVSQEHVLATVRKSDPS